MTSLKKQINNAVLALSENVIPHMDDEVLRGQLFAVVDILIDISNKADWSVDYLALHWELQKETFEKLFRVYEVQGLKSPVQLVEFEDRPYSGQTLKDRIEQNDGVICKLLDAADQTQDIALKAAIMKVLRSYMSQQTKIEIDFAHHPELNKIAKHGRG